MTAYVLCLELCKIQKCFRRESFRNKSHRRCDATCYENILAAIFIVVVGGVAEFACNNDIALVIPQIVDFFPVE